MKLINLKTQLEKLDFYFIQEVQGIPNVYKKVYAKDIAEENAKGVCIDQGVRFWTEEDCDHPVVIKYNQILMNKVIR